MDFREVIKPIADRFISMKENIQTEEATKNAFIMPFIKEILGYDVFNPLEVIPEYIADAGSKKGEKVDYCIKKDGEPILIIECKHWKENLDKHVDQLIRYYAFTKVKFAILTNGLEYRFYSDLEEKNKMDYLPFLKFDILNIKENEINELKRFNKDNFDVKNISEASLKFKIFNQIKEVFENDLNEPSDEFIKYFEKKLKKNNRKKSEKEEFIVLVKKAINSTINEDINNRLQQALKKTNNLEDNEVIENNEPEVRNEEINNDEEFVFVDEEKGIITTKEEINGYEIILDILLDVIDEDRVVYRDTKSYFGILLDDNNRKPICRLHFNTSNKKIEIFDKNKIGTKYPISKLEHIYKYASDITETVKNYLEE